ncbi:hypothetical protein BGZ80_008276, partial [Entomortierella chlamydospora]
ETVVVLAGYKNEELTADSCDIDQAINILAKQTSNGALLELYGMGIEPNRTDVPSHTPSGELLTRVPSKASTTSTLHASESESKFSPDKKFKTAQPEYSQSGELPADEYEMVVHTWNSTDRPYPSDRCIHELFEEQVVETPDAVALVHESRSMTY